ncbi:MAG TPA: STAS domain-containing protein [Kiritimatiellia bacterium]|nr:STAS domain-containing protein [Kiritimatiellia bacterium]
MNAAAPNQILAATADNCTLVAVSGAATFKLAPAFKQAVQAARLAGSALVVVDLTECRSLDSTFMGAIAGMTLALRKDDARLALINPSGHVAGLLRGLGLDRVLKTYVAAELPPGLGDLSRLVQNLRPVEAAPAGEHELAALMYDAHETLARVDPQNLQRFKDVLAFLREDLKRF